MSANQYLPTLREYVQPPDLPECFNFIEGGINSLFEKLYISKIQIGKSQNFASVNFYTVIRTFKKLSFEIPGTGLSIILNPEFDANVPGYNTEFPISVSLEWPIKKVFKKFQISLFDGKPNSFHDLIKGYFSVTDEELFKNAITVFKDNSSATFLADINNHYSLSPAINVTWSNEIITDAQNLVIAVYNNQQLIQLGKTPDKIVGDLYIDLLTGDSVSISKLSNFYFEFIGERGLQFFKELLIPIVEAELAISAGLELPRSILVPLQADPNNPGNLIPIPGNVKTLLKFDAGTFYFSTKGGIGFDKELSLSMLPQYSRIGNTPLFIGFTRAKLDLSRKTNIPEADADGRPVDFIGVYVQDATIGFPQFWNHDATNSSAVVKGRNLIIGTGGISGKISLEALNNPGPGIPAALFKLGDKNNTGKHFQLGITQFLMEFKQNAIVGSDIRGYMKVPGFKNTTGADAVIDVWIHIGNNGDFKITASDSSGVVFRVPNAFDIIVRSLSIGRENDKWYLDISGAIQITANIPGAAGDFLKQPIEVKRLRIWQDGSIEFAGGGITLPTQVHFNIGPVSLAMNHINFSPHEGIYQGVNRHYFCFGFNGELNTGSGGLAVRGDGVEFHFTRDAGPFHSYLRIAGIGIDIKVPGNASEEDADILIKGYLAMRNDPAIKDPGGEVITAGPEYQGSVTLNIKPLKISGKAAMIMRPKVPAFIVDIELDLSTPLSLGATGLGIYGFRGLVGSHYVASKPYIGMHEEDAWYEYLKKKVPPRNKIGIGIEKFDPAKKGFSLGIGATIGTMGDNGWTFSCKVFVMLSIPEMLLIEGQANVLHKRLGVDDENDPPFYAFLVIDRSSVQAGIGVNYKIPDNGDILSIRGEMQLGFFFGNSSAWYVNIGRDLPENKRLQARLFTLFNAYAYLMVSSKGIKAGAGANFEFKKKFGPVSFGLYAYIDTSGFISFKPLQLGGAIQLGGDVYLKVGRFGIELHVAAGLSAEAPKPFVIAGFLEIKIKIVVFKVHIKVEFVWEFNKTVNTDEVKLIDTGEFVNQQAAVAQLPVKGINMLSGESFALKYLGSNIQVINPETDIDWNNYIIPMDSYIDVEFRRTVKPYTNRYGGGINPVAEFTEWISPQKARYPQVKHSYSVEKTEIKIWNSTVRIWEDYDVWEALVKAFQNAGLSVNTSNYNFGYWQYNNNPGKYTSLRILSQTPFAVTNGTAPENYGILSQHILCQGHFEIKTCQYWNTIIPAKIYPAGRTLRDRKLLLRFTARDGSIGTLPNPFGIAPSLKVKASNKVEMFFTDSMNAVDLRVTALMGARIGFYQKKFLPGGTISGLPPFEYVLISQADYSWNALMRPVTYENPDSTVNKVVIEAFECIPKEEQQQLFNEYWNNLLQIWPGVLNDPAVPEWQKNQIRLWMSQYTDPVDRSILALKELCKTWGGLIAGHTLNILETELVENWRNRYCVNFQQVMWGVAEALCPLWKELIGYGPGRFPVLYYSMMNWQRLYCGAPNSEVLPLYELCKAWTNLIAGNNLNGEEYEYVSEWSAKFCYQLGAFGNVLAELCPEWGKLATSDPGNLPVLFEYIIYWQNKFCSDQLDASQFDLCSAYIHETCWLTEIQWQHNLLLQQNNQTVINAGINTLSQSINEALPPVWRPNSQYAVVVTTKDDVDAHGASNVTNPNYPYVNKYAFGFKTAGPIGFFHLTQKAYTDLAAVNKADQYKLANLLHYIDYQRSYPNADGRLTNAKPLYYKKPKLGLFFNKPYVYEFFTRWDLYKGNSATEYQLLSVISDPVDLPGDPPAVPPEVIGWKLHIGVNAIPISSFEIETISNILISGNPNCTGITNILKPPTMNGEIERLYDIKPQKLYKALFKTVELNAAGNRESVVHSYNFETSRYGGFKEHVESYISIMQENENLPIITRNAFFLLPFTKPAAAWTVTINKALQVLNNTLPDNDPVFTSYASAFDRMITGVLEMQALQAAVSTEFNIIKAVHADNNITKLIGILVRSPEPFNDPKLPAVEMARTLRITDQSNTGASFSYIFSNDNSSVFITNANMDMPKHTINIAFSYIRFNGKSYNLYETINVPVDLNSF